MRSVCVFCGSSAGTSPRYVAAARDLGRAIAASGRAVVYGGASVGLMGALADAALEAGGSVIGVIPASMVAKELAHRRLTELHVVKSMHERKAMMAERADAFVMMPGGYGTFEEFFEVLTWAQLGLHVKPRGALDVDGYFDRLFAFLEHAVSEGFVQRTAVELIVRDADASTLIERLAASHPPSVEKFLRADET